MRPMIPLLALAMLAGGCTERGIRAFSGPDGTTAGAGTLQVGLTDNEAGGVVVTGAGSRPTVALRFAVALDGAAATTVPDTGSLFAQVIVDTAEVTLLSPADSVPTGRYTSTTLTLTSAQLAIPGVGPIDLLGGTPQALVRRTVTVAVAAGEASRLTIDLNSGDWLVPVSNPAPGQAAFTFAGTTAFLDAIAITAP